MANRQVGYGLTAEVKARMDSKYDVETEQQVRIWMEEVTGRSLVADLPQEAILGPEAFQAALKDGTYLCEMMNRIQPKSCKPSGSKIAFKQMENIGMFLDACEKYGLKKQDMFQTVDLYDNTNIVLVLQTICALGRKCQTNGFNGPTLGPKESTATARDFDAELLRQGQNVIPMQSGSGAGAKSENDYGKRRQIMPDQPK